MRLPDYVGTATTSVRLSAAQRRGRSYIDWEKFSMVMHNSISVASALTVAALASSALAQQQGPSTGSTPYVVPTAPGVITKSIFTVGNPGPADSVNNKSVANGDPVSQAGNPYVMVGIPDGMGAYDNGDGTFTVLMNQEIGATSGVTRAHGSVGSFVSQYTINKSTLAVTNGQDLVRSVVTFDALNNQYNAPGTTAFGRLCSADLAAPSAYRFGALGTDARLFLNGEETGSEGRAFAHIATGSAKGTSYELPRLGKFSWENAVASPLAQQKTLVLGTDDSSPGEVYLYVGNKTATGNDVERAGLTNGNLYGIAVNDLPGANSSESRTGGLGTGAALDKSSRFSLFNHGDISQITGANLDLASEAAGVTDFLRPEDSAWNPNPAKANEVFFVTTDNVTSAGGRSRLYKMAFDDVTNPTAGGQIDMLLDGTEGHEMFDNFTTVVGRDGVTRLVLQEDPGGNARSAKIWLFDTGTGALTEVAKHDPARFGDVGSLPQAPFNNNEEASGIIPAFDLLGDGWFLMDVQAHYSTGNTETVEGGQLMAIYIPQAIPEPTSLAGLAVAGLMAIRRRRF
jgi:hypothetical protein